MQINQSKDDLEKLLKEQIHFLESSVSSFDKGYEEEIKRLAVTVRVLVHDTKTSISLLTMLDKKNDFFDSSCPATEGNLLTHSSLVQLHLNKSGSKPLPLLDDGPFKRLIKFDDWWNGIVFIDKNKNEFSRKDIVLALANKEGGAHVDKELDQKYFDLRKNNSLGWNHVLIDCKKDPSGDQVPSTMRQIAHEILKTIKEGYSSHRQKKADDGAFFLGGRAFSIGELQPIPKYNLVKSNNQPVSQVKVGRNDPCTCKSGKKFKKCCG